MAWHKPDNIAGSSAPAIMVGLFVACGGLLFGYDTGTISGILAMKAFRSQFSTGYIDPKDHLPNVSPAQSSQIVSILSAGTFFRSTSSSASGRQTRSTDISYYRRGHLLLWCSVTDSRDAYTNPILREIHRRPRCWCYFGSCSPLPV